LVNASRGLAVEKVALLGVAKFAANDVAKACGVSATASRYSKSICSGVAIDSPALHRLSF
jgi:hypothetical protein